MRSLSLRATCSALSLALAVLAGCADPHQLTEAHRGITPDGDALLSDAPTIDSLTLAADTVFIDGPPVTFTAILANLGVPRIGANLEGFLIQGGTQAIASGTTIDCGSGSGVLPTGSCKVSSTLSASSSVPGGSGLVGGDALFLLMLRDSTGLLDTASVTVKLVPSRLFISSLSVGDSTVTIDGPSAPFSALIQNSGGALGGIQFQGFIKQGTTVTSAAGGFVSCGSGSGVVPGGGCLFSSMFVASTRLGGPLVPGHASFELQVFDSTGTLFTSKTVDITLVRPTPTISALVPSTDTLVIDVTRPTYSATIQKDGANLSGMTLQGFVIQDSTRHAAGTLVLDCPSVSDTPSDSTCVATGSFFAFTSAPGAGTFLPGGATFELRLVDTTGTVVTERTLPVRLFAKPALTAVSLSRSFLKIGGKPVSFSVSASNPGPSLPRVSVTYFVTQGTARRAGGPAFDVTLPPGATTLNGSIVADNAQPGQGTLVPGAANVEVVLTYDGSTVVDRRIVEVTLR